MCNTSAFRCLSSLLSCLTALSLFAQEESPFTRLFDTGASSAEPLAAEAVAKRVGWTLVPEDKVDHTFSGDTVLLNDKLTVVLRKKGWDAEVYSKAADGLKHRATVSHAITNSTTPKLTTSSTDLESRDAVKTLENSSSAVMVEATFRSTGPRMLRFRLTTGEAILEIRSGEGAEAVVVNSRSRYVVVPDYFGDDMVFETGAPSPQPSPPLGERGPEERGRKNVYLPAENFCLGFLDGGDAILMNVWQSSEQDVWLASPPIPRTPSPTLGEREGVRGTRPLMSEASTSLHIECLKGKSIWLAFLESPGLWHARSASAKDDWRPPYPAKWRCGLVRENGVADSWTTEKPEAGLAERGADFGPPEAGSSTVKRPEGRAPNESLLVYPIDRSPATPLTVTCPTDIMRNTLGVGPCQYILACEGLAAQGDPTPNAVMNWVEKQFEGKKEKKAADDIQERLQTMTEHVTHARTRIERYAEFAGQVRRLIANTPGADAFRPIVADLDRFIATGLGPTGSPDRAKQLATEVSALIGKENALAACQRLGEPLRAIGAVQDGTLARCRMAVRRLKQQGRTEVAGGTPTASLAQEVQSLAEQMLQRK